jgi:hypothetical protein
MLRKVQDARPSLKRVIDLLESIEKAKGETGINEKYNLLASAGEAVARIQAEDEVKKSLEQLEKEQRLSLVRQAESIFIDIRNNLFNDMLNAAPVAKKEDEIRIRLGNAVLTMKLIGSSEGYDADAFPLCKWDVVLGGVISIRQGDPLYVWSSSIWYSKLTHNDDYRWREVSYFTALSVNQSHQYEPHALENIPDADRAAATMVTKYSIAFGPKAIDDEDLSDFKNRWSELLAKAAKGELRHPRQLPL